MSSSLAANMLANNRSAIFNFQPKSNVSTVFLEAKHSLLLLKRSQSEQQPFKWGVPGGKINIGETPEEAILRELQEETQIKLSRCALQYFGCYYARSSICDYKLHIYQTRMTRFPPVILDPKEHSSYKWVSLNDFKRMPLLELQSDAFDIVYR